MKPKALDLFCGAGGAARGLQQAGFYVVGVDIKPQPRYAGDEFHQGDAMTFPLEGFDFIWASPPCQAHSRMKTLHRHIEHPDLIPETRRRLKAAGIPWTIENVIGAPLLSPIMLCGLMFGLATYRHRIFESSCLVLAPSHLQHDPNAISWMTGKELAQAIPPAYSKFIGEQMMPNVLRRMQEAA